MKLHMVRFIVPPPQKNTNPSSWSILFIVLGLGLESCQVTRSNPALKIVLKYFKIQL